MREYQPSVGDNVYIYSTSLNEVIEGVLEGYADENNRRYKVLQYIDIEGSSLRHIVSYIYVFETYEEALLFKEEYVVMSSIDVVAGNTVYLLDKHRQPVLDRVGIPCSYQVVSVYRDTSKVGLVTSYGEYIGLYNASQVLYVSDDPLFKKEDYIIGTTVVWIDGEEVYEGKIDYLHESTATIRDVKKLYSVDHKVRVPYWRIPEGRKSNKESTTHVIQTIIGDDLD